MGFCMPHYSATFVVILMIPEIIFPVNGQCTVQGCDNKDQLMSIVDEILQLGNELFLRLDKQDQSIYELNASFQEMKIHLATANTSFQTVDRCPLERDNWKEQFQGMHKVFNESFQEMKSQHATIVTSIQAVDRRLEEHDISVRNQTRNSLEENDTCTRNQTQDSHTFANDNCDPASEMCDCSDVKANGQNQSGVYEVCVGHQLNRTCTSTFCDMETANRASLVFQRRKDGSVNFNRTWAEYREGFGNPDGEFWLGNEMLHLLTSKRKYKLRVDLEDWDGAKRYAEYSTFSISSLTSNYMLTLGIYSGTAGDSMNYHNGKQFSTIDADNDAFGRYNCAGRLGGAWWYYYCAHASLNGMYHNRNDAVTGSDEGILWSHWKNRYSLKAAEMKLVPVS